MSIKVSTVYHSFFGENPAIILPSMYVAMYIAWYLVGGVHSYRSQDRHQQRYSTSRHSGIHNSGRGTDVMSKAWQERKEGVFSMLIEVS